MLGDGGVCETVERAMSGLGDDEREDELLALERERSANMYCRGNKNDRKIPMYDGCSEEYSESLKTETGRDVRARGENGR